MKRFDYSFLKKKIPGNFIGIVDIISDLNAKESFRKLQYEAAFKKLKEKAIIESVKGSNAIEGIITSDDRIKDIISGSPAITHDEMEISGYKDALSLIHSEYSRMELNAETILKLHKMTVGMTRSDEAGQYKQRDNYIMEYLANGERRIRSRPVSSKDTSEALEQMLLAYYEARQDYEIPKLLLIPCVVLDFLCIHPFSDGNGRISRLLSVLMLYMSDYDVVKYVSFEGMINRYKESYYDALKQSSAGWHENNNDYMPFILFYLQILYRCFKELDESFTGISLKKAKKNSRIEFVLMSAIVPISKAEILDKLPDVSVYTVESVIKKLIKENKITKIGSYKDARYVGNFTNSQ